MPVDVTDAKTITEIGHRCRFPVAEGTQYLDGYLFCGKRVDKGFCCSHHARIAYDGCPEPKPVKVAA